MNEREREFYEGLSEQFLLKIQKINKFEEIGKMARKFLTLTLSFLGGCPKYICLITPEHKTLLT